MNNVYTNNRRIWEVDFFRGIAVVTMIIFNYAWALNFFGIIHILIDSLYWKLLAFGTAGTFIFLVGVSLTLSYSKLKPNKNYAKKYLIRGLKIFGYGIVVTLVSYILLKSDFVRFGILHFIGVGIILSIPFLKLKELNLFLGMLAIVAGSILNGIFIKSNLLLWLGLQYEGFHTVDYFPILPWFGLILIGIFFGNKLLQNSKKKTREKPINALRPFCFLGRHSLAIYFLHMVIILSVIYLLPYMPKIIN